MQVLKNLVNVTSRKLAKLFDRVNRRHKLIDEGANFQGSEGKREATYII